MAQEICPSGLAARSPVAESSWGSLSQAASPLAWAAAIVEGSPESSPIAGSFAAATAAAALCGEPAPLSDDVTAKLPVDLGGSFAASAGRAKAAHPALFRPANRADFRLLLLTDWKSTRLNSSHGYI